MTQELDNKTLNRLEKAVSKSEFSQGKKLKVVPKVRYSYSPRLPQRNKKEKVS
jgi:hypothetical protein